MTEDHDYFDHVLRKRPASALSNDCYRGCRKILGNYSDKTRKNQAHRATVEAVEKLSYEKLWMNTVLSRSAQFPDRLQRVKFVRGADGEGQYKAVPVEVTADNLDYATFPLEHFCINVFDPIIRCRMEIDLQPAISTLWDLQHKAQLHGFDDWRRLDKNCLQESWFERTKQGAPDKDTFDGGCDICSWSPGHDAAPPKPRAFDFAYLRQRSALGDAHLDLTRAFVQDAEDESSNLPRHGALLKRPRELVNTPSVISTPLDRRTLSPLYAAEGQQSQKRAKIDDTRRGSRTSRPLQGASNVAELPPVAALKKGFKYRINYMEVGESYDGFWDRDTGIDVDTDPNNTASPDAFHDEVSRTSGGLTFDTDSRLQHSSVDPALMRTPESLHPVDISQGPCDGRSPLRSSTSFPADVLTQTLLRDDQYPFFSTSSSFTLSGDSATTPDEVAGQQYLTDGTALKRQSMDMLRTHSAALHSAMGFGPLVHDTYSTSPPAPGGLFSHGGSQFDGMNAAVPEIKQDFSLDAAPSTPTGVARARNLANTMFTDETNRFTDFEQYGIAMPQETPTRQPSRRIFTLPEEHSGRFGH